MSLRAIQNLLSVFAVSVAISLRHKDHGRSTHLQQSWYMIHTGKKMPTIVED